jgi:oxygen-dependent protoporphyrinogen oxidase
MADLATRADTHVHDAIVVGGGIAGLSAGWRLRHRDVLLLEAGSRFGGRMYSERRGHYWLNFGAHVFGGPSTATGRLIDEIGIEALPVPGRLTALAANGVLLKTGRVETYPLRLPMPWSSRIGAVRAGAKVRLAVLRYARIAAERPGEDFRVRQQRMYDFLGERTFADFVGPLPADVDALFRPTVSRSAADPEELSAGAGVGYFHLVWDRGEGLSRNIVGGSSTLAAALGAALGPKALRGARVTSVGQAGDVVRVAYEKDGAVHEALARHVVVATPAYVTRKIVADLPGDVAGALERIAYGPYLVVSFLTEEQTAQPWDDCYAIATPGQPFNMVFNLASLRRGAELERHPGGSVMAYSAAGLARPLLEQPDDAVVDTYVRHLDAVLPGFSGLVCEAQVQRWPQGLAYAYPGRGRLQRALLRPLGNVILAGDYLGTWYTETAVRTGFAGAQEILSHLAGLPQASAGPDAQRSRRRSARTPAPHRNER